MASRTQGREGTIALLAIVGFIAIASWLIYGSSASQEEPQPPYSSFSGNAAGSRAFYELLERRGNDVARHMLSEHEYPQGSCVIIAEESALNPFKMVVNTMDVMALDLHLQDGGSLVLFVDNELALLEELEALLLSSSPSAPDHLNDPAAVLAGRGSKGKRAGSSSWRGSMDGRIYELSDARPGLLADVARLELADSWHTPIEGLHSVLSLEEAYGHPPFKQFVGLASHGKGSILIVNRPEIITNSWIDRADNHRLLLALVEGIAGDRKILFDEHVHGYNAKRMTAGSLLTSSTGGRLILLAILFIVLLYLGLAINPARIHPQKAPPRRQAAEMVLGQASLFKRARFERGSLRHIVDGLKHELMKSHDFARLPHDAELLHWAGLNMPAKWRMDPQLEEFLRRGEFPASRVALHRAALSCDAMRMRIWQRPLG